MIPLMKLPLFETENSKIKLQPQGLTNEKQVGSWISDTAALRTKAVLSTAEETPFLILFSNSCQIGLGMNVRIK